MRRFARLAVGITAALALASSSSLAAIDVEGTSVTFAWTASSGPVAFYSVHTDRNGKGFAKAAETTVAGPQVTVHGQHGETIRLRVTAWGWGGGSLISSAPSPASEEVRFVDPAVVGNPEPTPPPTSPPPPAPAPPPTSPPPPASTPPLTSPYDFNGDGRTDLLWRNGATQQVVVWLMNGASPPSIVDLGTLGRKWRFAGSGDFDGDGNADLLLRHQGRGESQIWLMSGGTVRAQLPLEGLGRRWDVEAIGDFDGDGYADLLWRRGKKSLIWFMDGASVDEALPGPSVKGLAPPACAPDLDGDGRSDVIWRGGEETVAWLMYGSSPWRSGPAGPRTKRSRAVGCGDADGDGFGDVLWYDRSSRQATLWAMNGDIAVDLAFELPPLDARWAVEASGDFDGDGLANDILIRDERSGEMEFWALRWNGDLTSFTIDSTAGPGTYDADWSVVAP